MTLTTHEPATCEGQPCCIHHPTQHHMVQWPQAWRQDRYLMERTCPHGVGHPDPDHMAHIRATRGEGLAWGQGVHGCDGCCRPTIPGLAPASHGYANGGIIHSGVDADHPPAWLKRCLYGQ